MLVAVAVKRRTILALMVITALIVSIFAGTQIVEVVRANFTPMPAPSSPVTDKPIVTLLMPESYTPVSNQTTILFEVAMPQTWRSSLLGSSDKDFWGTIRNVTCSIDQKQVLFDNTLHGRDAIPRKYSNIIPDSSNEPMELSYSCTANQVSLGSHNLTISVKADTLYMIWNPDINRYPSYYYYDVSTTETFSFEAVGVPVITNLYLENKTYSTPFLPLVYTINATASWTGYSTR